MTVVEAIWPRKCFPNLIPVRNRFFAKVATYTSASEMNVSSLRFSRRRKREDGNTYRKLFLHSVTSEYYFELFKSVSLLPAIVSDQHHHGEQIAFDVNCVGFINSTSRIEWWLNTPVSFKTTPRERLCTTKELMLELKL